jgi:hypothetical protein
LVVDGGSLAFLTKVLIDDFGAGGSTLNFEPGLENACDQSVQQEA